VSYYVPAANANLSRIVAGLTEPMLHLNLQQKGVKLNHFTRSLTRSLGAGVASLALVAVGMLASNAADLAETQRLLNMRPRETLKWRSPSAMMNELISSVALAN